MKIHNLIIKNLYGLTEFTVKILGLFLPNRIKSEDWHIKSSNIKDLKRLF